MTTVFIISPANCAGKRAAMLLDERSDFELARRLRTSSGITIAEAFGFMSVLYFRGKLAYAERFASESHPYPVSVILPGHGLQPPHTPIGLADLKIVAGIPVAVDEPRFRMPLKRAAASLAKSLHADDRAVLLGSIATPKYTEPLHHHLRDRLCVPQDFLGMGNMSRGSLLLRCVETNTELPYVPAPIES